MANATTELQWMRTPVPQEITPGGIYVPHLTNLKTRALGALVQGAIEHEYVLGKYDLVLGQTRGFLRYMFDTVQKEGIVAKLDDFISFYPVMNGALADESAALTEANDVVIRGRFLKDLKLDRSKFTFREVGVDDARVTITTYGSSFGDKAIGKVSGLMHVVGKRFVANAASKVAYTYVAEGGAVKTGTFDILNWTDNYCFDIKVKTSDTVWPTIPAGAAIELAFELYVSGEAEARKQTLTRPAVVAAEQNPPPTVTSAHGSGPSYEEGKVSVSGGVIVNGTLLANGTAHIKYTGTDSQQHVIDVTEFQSKSATQMVISNSVWEGHAVDTTIGGKVYVTDGALTSNEYNVTFTA